MGGKDIERAPTIFITVILITAIIIIIIFIPTLSCTPTTGTKGWPLLSPKAIQQPASSAGQDWPTAAKAGQGERKQPGAILGEQTVS